MRFMTTGRSSSRHKVLSACLAGLVAVAGLGLAPYAAAGATSGIQPVRQCAELVGDYAIGGRRHMSRRRRAPSAPRRRTAMCVGRLIPPCNSS